MSTLAPGSAGSQAGKVELLDPIGGVPYAVVRPVQRESVSGESASSAALSSSPRSTAAFLESSTGGRTPPGHDGR